MAFKFDFFSDGTETKEETPKSKLCPLDGNVTKVDLCSLKLVPYYTNPTILSDCPIFAAQKGHNSFMSDTFHLWC